MHVDDLFWTKDLAVKASDAVLAKFNLGQVLEQFHARDFWRGIDRCHVDDVSWANDVANSAAGTTLNIDSFDHLRSSWQPVRTERERDREFRHPPIV